MLNVPSNRVILLRFCGHFECGYDIYHLSFPGYEREGGVILLVKSIARASVDPDFYIISSGTWSNLVNH